MIYSSVVGQPMKRSGRHPITQIGFPMFRTILPGILLCASVTNVAASSAHDHDHGPVNVQYIENKGQWPQEVLYRTGVNGATVFLEKNGTSWVKIDAASLEQLHDYMELSPEEKAAFVMKGYAWRVRFEGASPDPAIVPMEKANGYHNYFYGNDPSKWVSEVGLFGVVKYDEVWPGIDVIYHSVEGNMKYDVVLAPGADPSLIALRYDGLDKFFINEGGNVVLQTSVGNVMEMAPVAFYSDGAREPIGSRYVLENGVLRYSLDQYDASRPVTIDPVLIASTLSGATGASNYGHCATYDIQGNIYTGARNFGPSYPVTTGAFQSSMGGGGTDMSFSKYNADGSDLIWASYLGGSDGENPHSMVVNSQGQLCILGTTSSSNFPVTANAYDNTYNSTGTFGTDMTVTVVHANGTSLIGSTFIGGSDNDGLNGAWANYGESYRGEIIVDAADNIVIASCTSSGNFPVTGGAYQSSLGGAQDAVVLGLSPNASALTFSTFLGGSQLDSGMGVRIVDGQIVVCGYTDSSDFPVGAGGYQSTFQGGTDGFVVKLNGNANNLIAGTFFGTGSADRAYFLDHDLDSNIWIYGQTEGTIAIQPAGTWGEPGGSMFITKLDNALSAAEITSVFGTSAWGGTAMAPVAFLVDVCDNIYISGYNSSSGLPLTPNSLASTGSFYLAAFEVDMQSLLFGTYFGGSHVDGGTSRFDKNGIIYQGVCSGMGSMNTTSWAWATNQTIGWDIGVFKIDFQVAGVNAAGASTLNQGCAPIQIDFSNASTGDTWVWDFGDGSPTVEEFEPSHLYTVPGTYTVTLIALDSLTCNLADTTYLEIVIGEQQPITADMTIEQVPDCQSILLEGENLSTGSNIAFTWLFGDGTTSSDTNAVHIYTAPGEYTVQLIAYDPAGCSPADTVSQVIELQPEIDVTAIFTVEETPGCDELGVLCQSTSIVLAPVITWDMGDGTQLSGETIDHLYTAVGTYTITMTVNDTSVCGEIADTTFQVTVEPSVPVAVDFTAEQTFDCDDLLLTTQNNSTGTNMIFNWQLSDGSQYSTENVQHTFSGVGTYTITLTVSDSLGCSPPATSSMDVTIDPLTPVVAAFDVEQVGHCSLLTVQPIDQSSGDSISISWDMGDGTIYDGAPPQHQYTTPGTYTILLTVTDLGCGNDEQASIPVVLLGQLPIVMVGDSVVCPDGTATLVAEGPPGDYTWSTGETGPSITVNGGGQYTVSVITDDCFGQATADVIHAPRHELTYEVQACPNASVELTVPLEGLSYSWDNGSNDRSTRVLGAGTYYYDMVDLLGCPHSDSVKVIALDEEPQMYAPNAFSPDGDGVNDVFKVVGYGEKEVELDIFNRWGELIYQSTGGQNGWDGQFNGLVVKNDVYVYRLKYTGICDAEEREVIGHVTVLK
jgi:gliding motility-associated-like protein